MRRAPLLTMLAALAYLAAATLPCPDGTEPAAQHHTPSGHGEQAHGHHEAHDHHGEAQADPLAKLAPPCQCGCGDAASAGAATNGRLGPVLVTAGQELAPPPAFERAPAPIRSMPDAPLALPDPIPIG